MIRLPGDPGSKRAARQAILSALSIPHTANQVSKRFGYTLSGAHALLRRMTAAGLLEKVGNDDGVTWERGVRYRRVEKKEEGRDGSSSEEA